MRWLISLGLVVGLMVLGPLVMLAERGLDLDARWYEAGRESAGLAPDPAEHEGAMVQVYAARAFSWRGILGAHSWIALKDAGAESYRVLQVTTWRNGFAFGRMREPDRAWFDNEPVVLAELRGDEAAVAIAAVEDAVARYPWGSEYRIWPGPNSNTFVAWVLRQVPEIDAELPPTAIGKDYLGNGWVARTPSGTGYQFSARGLLGVTVALEEGLEVNLLGLVLGVDPGELAIKLPGIGRLGFWGMSPAG